VTLRELTQRGAPRPAADEEIPPLPRSSVLGLSLLGVEPATPDANLTGGPEKKPRTKIGYLLPFEIVSVHLLVVLVGAAYLARTKRRKGAPS
jgi:NADH-quinone oxidoreductase subunit J